MSISKIVNFTVLINPTIILQENANLETSSLALNFTVDHPVTSISYSLDGQAPTPISGNFTLSNLSNGQHNVTVYTIDKATNITTSDTRCFYVQAPVQAPQNQFPISEASFAAAIIIGASISLFFIKRRKTFSQEEQNLIRQQQLTALYVTEGWVLSNEADRFA